MLDQAAITCDQALYFKFDEQNRTSSWDGPVLEFATGFKLYAVEGFIMDPMLFENPDKVDPKVILKENNTEIRRILVRLYGEKRLAENGGKIVHSDDRGDLIEIDIGDDDDKPARFIRMVNSTPEPDGTYKIYLERVPPETKTATEAIAIRWGEDADTYNPEVET
jgi:hypothetical protein